MYAFDLIFGLNSGAVPRMGLHPIAPAPFGSCLFSCYLICVVPNKAVKNMLPANPSLGFTDLKHTIPFIFTESSVQPLFS